MKAAAQQVLEENILKFWADRMYDPKGGFYGRMDGHNVLHPEAERGAVLNARLLWSFSAAYRVLHKPEYLDAARWAKDYIEAHFLDREHGGVYWSLTADGTPLDTKKQTYAIGFMIYAFSEFARATGDKQALQQAIRLYADIEEHAFISRKSKVESQKPIEGYVEALTRDWQPIADMRLSDKDENAAFTMNTHLHVLEPYTSLYRIWPDERLRERLQTLIGIFTDRLYNPINHHVDCFFDTDWNGRRDIASYGHDIEAAWLLNEAAMVLNDHAPFTFHLSPFTFNIANASLEGLQADGSMIHEAKFIGAPNATYKGCGGESGDTEDLNVAERQSASEVVDRERQWWVLCEAVIGFIDQWQLTGDKLWYQRAEKAWDYLSTHLIDREHGEWFWAILPDGTPDTANDKAGFWKCPYHNSRMCLELIERL